MTGEFLTRATIWLALAGYAAAAVFLLRTGSWNSARLWWTIGCLAYVAHVVCAFHFSYDWSHATGLSETARQTEALTGRRSGAGLYVNYFFTLVWAGDVVYWWRAGLQRYRERPAAIHGLLHAFFLFMVVNGTVVFGQGPVRWFGAGILLVLAVAAGRFYFLRRK